MIIRNINSLITQIAAMSPRVSTLVVVMVAFTLFPDQTSSLPQPSISFERLGKQKDNLVKAAGGIKAELLSPIAGVARGVVAAKKGIVGLAGGIAGAKLGLATGLAGAKLGLAKGIAGAKLGLARGILRPVAGIKRVPLLALRELLNKKISLLDGF